MISERPVVFGQLALKYGYITLAQLKEALKIQKERIRKGRLQRLGEVLVDLAYIKSTDLVELFCRQLSEGARPKINNYQIIESIGKGSMGEVYKAFQLSLEREVALKILSPELSKNKKFVEGFLKEAKLTAQLNHQNIIHIIDAGEFHGIYYNVMEYVDGISVKQMVTRSGALPVQMVIEIGIRIADALMYSEMHDIVHRDIKPSNIMITSQGVVKLCDFSLAHQRSAGDSVFSKAIVGTPSYMSPEQGSQGDIDIRSDIYSLGATLYYISTEKYPFPGSMARIFLDRRKVQPQEPWRPNPKIPKKLGKIILTCLNYSPDKRFQSPAELKKALLELRGSSA